MHKLHKKEIVHTADGPLFPVKLRTKAEYEKDTNDRSHQRFFNKFDRDLELSQELNEIHKTLPEGH